MDDSDSDDWRPGTQMGKMDNMKENSACMDACGSDNNKTCFRFFKDAAAALKHAKATGDDFFQQGEYDDAYLAYKQGLSVYEGYLPEIHNPSAELQALAVALYCSAAATALRCTGMGDSCANQALTMANKALALEPRNVAALFQKGCAHIDAEDWNLAADNFQQVLQLDPGNAAVRHELQKLKDRIKAGKRRHSSSHALTKTRDSFEHVVAGAEYNKSEGVRLFQAEKFYESYEVWKQGIDALESLGPSFLDEATKKLKIALCCNAAQALLRCPEIHGASTDQALKMTEKVLELEPANVKALFRRGCAFSNAKNWRLAHDDFEGVLELEPTNEAAKSELQRTEKQMIADHNSFANQEEIALLAERFRKDTNRIYPLWVLSTHSIVSKLVPKERSRAMPTHLASTRNPWLC